MCKMKKTTIIALLTTLALAFGCATTASLPDRLDKFVEKTEKECKDYTAEDWNKSRKEYDVLVSEMKDNYDSFTTSEKVQAAKAMSRYGALLVEDGISNAVGSLTDIFDQVPEVINGIIDQIDTTAIRQGIQSIEGIIESIDTAKIRKSLEGMVESVDTAKLRQKLEAVIKMFGRE